MKNCTWAVLLVSLLVGCHGLDKNWKSKLPWSKSAKEAETVVPARMAVIWTPDVMMPPNQSPKRGFGGRVYFYNSTNKAVPVEGQLVVYGYDDSNVQTTRESPDRKFVFTPEQFRQHYSQTDLGASYSVWVPWEEAGGPQKSISLLPVFTATSGQVVLGQQAINVLPGRAEGQPTSGTERQSWGQVSAAASVLQTAATGVRPAAYDHPAGSIGQVPYVTAAVAPTASLSPAAESRRSIQTLTIDLPRSLRQQLHAGVPTSQPAAQSAVAGTTSRSATPTAVVNWSAPPPSAAVPPAAGNQPASRFAPMRFPVPASRAARPNLAPARSAPNLTGSPSGHPAPLAPAFPPVGLAAGSAELPSAN